MAIIECENITKVFPPMVKDIAGLRYLVDLIRGRLDRVTALRDLSLEVNEGEVFGLLGPNGAGKTTLCKIINALVIPNSGRVSVDGLDAIRDHRRITERMLTVFGGEQELQGVFGWRLSVRRNLRFVADLWRIPGAEAERRIENALELLEFADKGDEWFQKLSAGARQKLLMAVPLVVRPRILILDEPTIKLDVMARRQAYDILTRHLNRELGTTVLLTTHQIDDAEQVCDRVGIINRGELAALGSPEDLVRDLGGGQVVRIEAEVEPETLVRQLERLDFVIEVRPLTAPGRPPRFEIATRNRDAVPAIMALCADLKLPVKNLSATPASLEDVFVNLVRGPATGGEPR